MEKKKSKRKLNLENLGIGVGASYGGAIAGNTLFVIPALANKRIRTEMFNPSNIEDTEKIKRDIAAGAKRMKLKEPVEWAGRHQMGPAYTWDQENKKHNVYSSKKSPRFFTYHELGHAKNWEKVPKILRNPIGRISRIFLPKASIAAGALSLASKDPDSKLSKAAPYMVLGGYAPMLVDEATASGRAIKHLGKPAIKPLLAAFGSYAGIAGGSALGMEAARRIIKKRKNKSR